MPQIIEYLSGKKSYGIAAGILFAVAAFALHWIDQNTFLVIVSALLGTSVATLRSGFTTEVETLKKLLSAGVAIPTDSTGGSK